MNRLNVEVRATENSGEWEVMTGLEYFGIQVQPGMTSDGASVPWVAQWLVRKGGPLFTPSVIHDVGYRNGLRDRLAMDNIFMEAMKENKVPKWKRELIYSAVRLFGASSYIIREITEVIK